MSLASDVSGMSEVYMPSSARNVPSSARNAEGVPRWSRMRSQEGSQASETSERRMIYSRPQSEPMLRSARGPVQRGAASTAMSSMDQPQSEAARIRANALQDTEVKRIVEAVGKHCIDNIGTLQRGLHELRVDEDGNLMRSDVRRWFIDHRVATRMADKVFDNLTDGQRANPNDRRNSDIIRASVVKDVFKAVVGEHLEKGEAKDGKHKHHNMHGLLRPQHSEGSILSIPNADSRHVCFTTEKLKKIAKQMTGKAQKRYVDKYGICERQELQHLFESYGLEPKQANEIFNKMDTERAGEVKFKDLNKYLTQYLHVEEQAVKKKKNTGPRANALDDETMREVCDHVGHKAFEKSKTVQGAFRFVERDIENKVDRFEVRNFFRNYGSKTATADRFFDTVDTKREGKIDFGDFADKFAPYIQPGHHPPAAMEEIKKKQKAQKQKDQKDPAGRRSSRTSNVSVSSSLLQDELQQSRFGRFEGVSTYNASYNAHSYGFAP